MCWPLPVASARLCKQTQCMHELVKLLIVLLTLEAPCLLLCSAGGGPFGTLSCLGMVSLGFQFRQAVKWVSWGGDAGASCGCGATTRPAAMTGGTLGAPTPTTAASSCSSPRASSRRTGTGAPSSPPSSLATSQVPMCTSVNVPLELLRLPWRPEAHPVCNTTSYLSVAALNVLW